MTLPLVLSTMSGQTVPFKPGLPVAFSCFRQQGAQAWYAQHNDYGHLIYQQISESGFSAWLSHFVITKPTRFHVKANVDDLLLHYVVKGTMRYVLDNHESPVSDHQLNLIVANRLNNDIYFEDPGVYIALTVHIPICELQQFYDSFPVVRIFLEKTASGCAVTLMQENILAQEKLRNIVQDIQERELVNFAAERYHLQKIVELVIESLDLLSQHLQQACSIHAADHEKGEKTEVFLMQHLQKASPPTLKQLARVAGTNEKKLEDIFRLRHGVTVYDFFQNARMKIIYRRLLESKTPLQDLSEDFGYSDYSSFSFAVKKRFGYSPRELRKNIYAIKQ